MFRLPLLRQVRTLQGESKVARTQTYRRTTIRVPLLWTRFRRKIGPYTPSAHTHRRTAVSLRIVWQVFCTRRLPIETSNHTHTQCTTLRWGAKETTTPSQIIEWTADDGTLVGALLVALVVLLLSGQCDDGGERFNAEWGEKCGKQQQQCSTWNIWVAVYYAATATTTTS